MDLIDNIKALANSSCILKIKQLRECGVEDYIKLPELVAVGDQSSGKSSVLEGITGLPFPRDSTLCTRFATRITFLYAEEESIEVKIEPAEGSSEKHKVEVGKWRKDLDELNTESFVTVMEDAYKQMNVGGRGNRARTFSDDVLVIELSGPNTMPLSIVDVPGIFRNPTPGVTTERDMDLVRSMVQGYMSNPHSIMLVVVAANVDISNQEILRMAKAFDPDGVRTVGILTKPDLVDKKAEKPFLDMLNGKSHKLKLGWHIVRNPGQADLTKKKFHDRIEAEKTYFTEHKVWRRVEEDNRGIPALRTRLQDIGPAHFERGYPKVRKEIQKQTSKREDKLAALGPTREDIADIKRYLVGLGARYQELASAAVRAEYGDPAFDDVPTLKLAKFFSHRTDVFNEDFCKFGHSYEFDFGAGGTTSGTSARKPVKPALHPVRHGEQQTHAVLEDLFADELEQIAGPETGVILDWLAELWKDSRGVGLCTSPAAILASCMKKQCTNWELLTLGYVYDVICLVHTFMVDLMKHICKEPSVCKQLQLVLSDQFLDCYRKAIDNAKFQLEVESTNTPNTLNDSYDIELQEIRRQRHPSSTGIHYRSSDGSGTVLPRDNSNVHDSYDILCAYYKKARERIVENVFRQAACHFLVTGKNTPLKLFGPQFVDTLTEEQIKRIAEESPETKRTRKRLNKELDTLRKAKRICM